MKIIVESIPDLQALYVRQLRTLLSAEKMIGIKTQYLTDRATDPELKQLLRDESRDAHKQADRVSEILTRSGYDTSPIKCRVVYALFDEAEELVEDTDHEAVRDAVIIAEAQRIKHYEIATYGAMREFAHVLGREDDAQLLEQSAQSESDADRKFTQISERVNAKAKDVTRSPRVQ